MRIAIIGAGSVGGGLGRAFAAVGHDVVFGVRDPDSTKTQAALADIEDAVAMSPAEAVDGADLVVIAAAAGRRAVDGRGARLARRPRS